MRIAGLEGPSRELGAGEGLRGLRPQRGGVPEISFNCERFGVAVVTGTCLSCMPHICCRVSRRRRCCSASHRSLGSTTPSTPSTTRPRRRPTTSPTCRSSGRCALPAKLAGTSHSLGSPDLSSPDKAGAGPPHPGAGLRPNTQPCAKPASASSSKYPHPTLQNLDAWERARTYGAEGVEDNVEVLFSCE